MHYWNSPFVDWHRELPAGWDLYVCHIRASRNKARIAAVREILALLIDYEPFALLGGPLADQKGVFWIGIDPAHCQAVAPLLKHSGYTDHMALLRRADQADEEPIEPDSMVTWQGELYYLQTVYREDRRWMRNRAPDRRAFMMKDALGAIVPVRGYRGDSGLLSRRGLPPEDARLLANLVRPRNLAGELHRLLDPFAGVGGIVLEARDCGFQAFSMDIDPVVQYGLNALTGKHSLASAGELPFADCSFFAIATEPPFHAEVRPVMLRLMREFERILRPGGKVSLMIVGWQMALLEPEAARLGFVLLLKEGINRKGTAVEVGVWQKPEEV